MTDLGQLDEADLRRSLDLFWPHSEVCAGSGVIEIRLWQRPKLEGIDQLDKAKKRDEKALRGFFDDPDQAVEEIKKFDADPATVGIFAVLNQIDPDSIKNRKIKIDNRIGKGQSTKDQDISRRCWLPLDFDPERPAGIMATDQEKQAAKKAQAFINEILIKQHGWPDPIVVDSGNGYHDLFRIDLPNDDNSKILIRSFFKALNKLLPDLRGLAKVDEAVFNASRVIKLPSTMVRKRQSEDRPWRRSRILYEPVGVLQKTVSEAQIQAIVDLADRQVKETRETPQEAVCEASAGRDRPKKERSTTKKEADRSAPKKIEDLINDPLIRDCIRQKIFTAAMSGGAAGWSHSVCLGIATELLAAGFDDGAVHQVFGQVFGDGYDPSVTQSQLDHTKATYLADGGGFWTCQELQDADVIDEEVCAGCPSRKPVVEMPKVDPDPAVAQNLLDRVVRVEEATKDRPYGVDLDGCTYKRVKIDKAVFFVKIADGFGFIDAQTRRENGDAIFSIRGRGSQDGHEFCFDLPGADFSDPRKLKAKLTAQFGGRNVITKDFNSACIQRLSKRIKDYRLVEACRWLDGACAVPGLNLVDAVKFNIHKKVPASFEDQGDLDLGIRSFKALMQAWTPGHQAILAATVFGAPVAAKWWSDDRYALALIGLTGTGKTEASRLMLSCYGRGYLQDGNLLRWNDGATANATQQIAAQSGFLPLLIDNYKPIKSGSPAQLVGVLHAILEGSEKSRLDRNAQLRDTLEFMCTPIITGESYIEESSTLARSILIEWLPVTDAAKLTEAQFHADHLLEIGRSWLTWASSAEGKVVIEEVRSGYPKLRSEAVGLLNEIGCINAGRIGSSVALVKCLWQILIRHPVLGEIFKPYSSAISEALLKQLQDQSDATIQANEAERFIAALRELVTSGRGIIVKGASGLRSNSAYGDSLYAHPERILGWQDEATGDYWLYPDAAKKLVALHQGRQTQEIDARTLNRQLRDRGYLVVDEKQKHAQQARHDPITKKTARFLVFKKEVGLNVLQVPDGEMEIDLTQAEAKVRETEIRQTIYDRLAAVCRIG
jgi:hypothetical protein